MMIVTSRLDASDTLLREVLAIVGIIYHFFPPSIGKETDFSSD